MDSDKPPMSLGDRVVWAIGFTFIGLITGPGIGLVNGFLAEEFLCELINDQCRTYQLVSGMFVVQIKGSETLIFCEKV